MSHKSQVNSSQPPQSPKSPNSVKSAGIGEPVSSSSYSQLQIEADLPRPLAEGVLSSNEPLYDSIAYVIICPEHQSIAVTNLAKCKCVWLPFVPLPEGLTWQRAAHDGVSLLIGRNDAEMEAEEAERLQPKYSLSYLHILRLQLPSTRVVIRLTVLVELQKNLCFECCCNTERVNWLLLTDIAQSPVQQVWGPELKMYCSLLNTPLPQLLHEYTVTHSLYYLHQPDSWQGQILHTFKLRECHVQQIWTEFLEHCYPSMGMSLESFRVYFLKYGITYSDVQLARLFNAFCHSDDQRTNDWIEFHQFITSLITMEPNCPSRLEARNRLIFCYYDIEQKGVLTVLSICALLKDAMPLRTDVQIEESARKYLKTRTQLNFEEFINAGFPLSVLHRLVRSPQSMLKQITRSLACKAKERARANRACEGVLKARRTTKGTCWVCRAQQYEYGNHAVTLDTVGRCVEPTLMPVTNTSKANSSSQQYRLTRSQYSVECVFQLSSVPNIFLDLIRDFHVSITIKKDTQRTGLMTQSQEWNVFHKYFNIMVNELCAALDNEHKLIKTNGPAIVVGEIAGNLHDLLQLETLLWQSFPVISENLVFLGNYSGENCSYGLECLIYLIAIKLCSPNKVFLLRGTREIESTTSESALKSQCCAKYGPEHGLIVFNIVSHLFAKLPVAVVLDDAVLCTHSGIPSRATRLSPLLKAPKEMITPQRDCPMAQEIITRFPDDVPPEESIAQISNTPPKSSNIGTTIAPHAPKNKIKQGETSKKSAKSYAAKSPSKSVKSTKSTKKYERSSTKKSLLLATKSTKSIKSSKCSPEKMGPKYASSTKSNKSLKSVNSKKMPLCMPASPLLPSQPLAPPSTNPTLADKIQPSSDPYHFEIGAQLSNHTKQTFLTKNIKRKVPGKSNKKRTATVPANSKRPKSTQSKTETAAGFDESEFAEFMAANDFAFLIRSGATHHWPEHGFKLSSSAV